jgi:hypothetical protein
MPLAQYEREQLRALRVVEVDDITVGWGLNVHRHTEVPKLKRR